MRELTGEEQTYVSSIIREELNFHKPAGIFTLLITVIALFSTVPEIMKDPRLFNLQNIIGGSIFIVFIILGLGLIFSAKKTPENCKISTERGAYREKTKRRGGSYRQYIGKKIVNLPSAWVSSLERNKEYTVEIYEGGRGFTRFTPIVLSVEGMEKSLANISLNDMRKEEKALGKMGSKIFISFFLAVLIPIILVTQFFRYMFTSDRGLSFLSANSDKILNIMEFSENGGTAGSIVKFLINNGIPIFIAIFVALFILIRVIFMGKASGSSEVDLSGKSWQNWLSEYSSFMENDFGPMMKGSSSGDSSVIMEYRETMKRHKQYQMDYRYFKKNLTSEEKKLLTQEIKAVNKQMQSIMNKK